MFESDLSGQLADTVHQVLTLSVDHLSDVIKVRLRVLVLPLHLINLLLLNIKFVLLARKVLMQVDLHILFGLKLLLKHQLLSAALFDLCLRFHELLLLLHGLLHDLSALEKLALHVVNFLQEFLLLRLFLLLLFVFFVELGDYARSFFLGDLLLGQDAGLLLFELLGHLFLLLLE